MHMPHADDTTYGRPAPAARAFSYEASADLRVNDVKGGVELALFSRFREALGDSELLLGNARAGQTDCTVPGATDHVNEPDVVCSLASGLVRYFESARLVPKELMELIHCPFLDYRDLLSESDVVLLESRYQGCYLSYDEPDDERVHRAAERVLRYLAHGEPATDFAAVDGQITVPYESVDDNGDLVPRPLAESWQLAPSDVSQYPGVTVAQLMPHGPPDLRPSARTAKDPAVSLLRQKCTKRYFDPASALRVYPELILWSTGDTGFDLEKSADALDSPAARDAWEVHFSSVWLFDRSTGCILHLLGHSSVVAPD